MGCACRNPSSRKIIGTPERRVEAALGHPLSAPGGPGILGARGHYQIMQALAVSVRPATRYPDLATASSSTTGVPPFTISPGRTLTRATRPARGARTWCSIFIASSSTSG